MTAWSPRQREVWAAVHDDDVRVVVCVGPVQSGKTHVATWALLSWLSRRHTDEDALVCGRTQGQLAGAALRQAQRWSDSCRGGWRRRRDHWVLRSALGGHNRAYQLIGSDVGSEAKARSYSAVAALVDEGTLVPAAFLNAVQDRLSRPDSKLVVMTNPAGPKHPLREGLVEDALTDDSIRVYNFSLSDNPTLTEDYIARLGRRYTGAQYRRMVLGEWAASEGLVWPEIGGCLEDPPTMSQVWRWTVGVDWAHSSVTSAVVVGRDLDGVDHVTDEWRHDGATQGQLGEVAQADRIAAFLRRRGHAVSCVWVDPSAVAMRRALSAALPGTPVRAADNDIDEGVQFVRRQSESGRLRLNRHCDELVSECLNYAWDEKRALLGEDRPLKQRDHGPDALRYALWSQTGVDRRRPVQRLRAVP